MFINSMNQSFAQDSRGQQWLVRPPLIRGAGRKVGTAWQAVTPRLYRLEFVRLRRIAKRNVRRLYASIALLERSVIKRAEVARHPAERSMKEFDGMGSRYFHAISLVANQFQGRVSGSPSQCGSLSNTNWWTYGACWPESVGAPSLQAARPSPVKGGRGPRPIVAQAPDYRKPMGCWLCPSAFGHRDPPQRSDYSAAEM
jgi:hypothetical protein